MQNINIMTLQISTRNLGKIWKSTNFYVKKKKADFCFIWKNSFFNTLWADIILFFKRTRDVLSRQYKTIYWLLNFMSCHNTLFWQRLLCLYLNDNNRVLKYIDPYIKTAIHILVIYDTYGRFSCPQQRKSLSVYFFTYT